ncbi:MAG: ATP synthase F1 subunit epsilon [Bacteroidales bacterium]
MYLEIITPDKEIFKGEVKSITVPGTSGSFEVLENHAPIISTLEEGKLRIIDASGKESFVELAGGVIEVKNNRLILLAKLA